MKLSLCIATYNEEKNIHYPIESALDIVDEVIIVDGGSTDQTSEKALSFGKKIRVFRERYEVMFHKNKQKAIEKARGEWILQLDADEALSEALKEEIKNIVGAIFKSPEQRANQDSPLHYVAYQIPRKNFFLSRFLSKGGQYPDYTIRLYKNGAAKFPCKSVHENVEILTAAVRLKDKKSETAAVKNNIGYLKNPILHYADPTFSRYLQRWDRYTSAEAEQLIKTFHVPRSTFISFMMFVDYFVVKPTSWFLWTYFRHKGFVDGFPGFIFSLFSSLRFWAIYVKWWQISKLKNRFIRIKELL